LGCINGVLLSLPRRRFLGLRNLYHLALFPFHRQQALAAGDQRPRGVNKRLRIYLESPHFQYRISGMSWPCL
jgi:hypothetical protein